MENKEKTLGKKLLKGLKEIELSEKTNNSNNLRITEKESVNSSSSFSWKFRNNKSNF